MARVRGGDYISGFTQDDPWGYDGGWSQEAAQSSTAYSDPWQQEQQQAPSEPAAPAQDNTWEQYRQALQNQYQQYLGRTASDQELDDQFGGNYSYDHWQAVMNSIPQSEEAQQYLAYQQEQPDQYTEQGSQQPVDEEIQQQGVLASYDPAKLASPEHALKSPKYAWLQIAQKYPNTPEGFEAAFAEAQQKYPQFFSNWRIEGDDSLVWNQQGELADEFMGHTGFDVWRNASNDDPNVQSAWNWESHQGAEPVGGSSGSGSGSGFTSGSGSGFSSGSGSGFGSGFGSGSSSGSSSGSTTVNYSSGFEPPPGVSDELWSMLMSRAKQGLNVSRTDPNVRSQADAYSAQEERARRNFLGDLAERSSPYGTGHMLGQERMTAAGVGQRVGAFESQLIGQEIAARREEIAQALTEMGDLLTDQQKMTLQKQLAEMDASLERLRLDNQNAQYYAGLSQQDRHFLDEMGYKRDTFGQEMDYRWGTHLDDLGFRTREQDNYWDWKQRGND